MKLVIFLTTRERRAQVETSNPVIIDGADFPSWTTDQLEMYGFAWARFFKTDIVMLVNEEDE